MENNGISKEMLIHFINQNFKFYKADKIMIRNSSIKIIEFQIGTKYYQLSNDFKKVNYLNLDDEATIFSLKEINKDDTLFDEHQEFNIIPIDQVIKNIYLIKDNYSRSIENKDITYSEIRSLIFVFDDYELAFIKDNSRFSMEIHILKGQDLLNEIKPNDFILEGENKEDFKIDRDIIKI